MRVGTVLSSPFNKWGAWDGPQEVPWPVWGCTLLDGILGCSGAESIRKGKRGGEIDQDSVLHENLLGCASQSQINTQFLVSKMCFCDSHWLYIVIIWNSPYLHTSRRERAPLLQSCFLCASVCSTMHVIKVERMYSDTLLMMVLAMIFSAKARWGHVLEWFSGV